MTSRGPYTAPVVVRQPSLADIALIQDPALCQSALRSWLTAAGVEVAHAPMDALAKHVRDASSPCENLGCRVLITPWMQVIVHGGVGYCSESCAAADKAYLDRVFGTPVDQIAAP